MSTSANGIYDLRFTDDSSERLTLVKDDGGTRELKHYLFGSANDTSHAHELPARQAHDRHPDDHLRRETWFVTETYKYQKPSGRTSERDTAVTTGATMQSYQQLFAYDDIGSL